MPVVISLALRLCMKAAGSALSSFLTASSARALRFAAPSGTMSSRTTGTPALVMWAAMPAPMTPAPMTPTFLISAIYTASRMVAMPWPPPMHWVASA